MTYLQVLRINSIGLCFKA